MRTNQKLDDAIRYLKFASDALRDAGQPLLALRLGAISREADVRRGVK